MPQVKCPVDSLFTQQPPKPGYKLGKRACMFCSTSVSDNGTRMMAHIKLCKDINDDERESSPFPIHKLVWLVVPIHPPSISWYDKRLIPWSGRLTLRSAGCERCYQLANTVI